MRPDIGDPVALAVADIVGLSADHDGHALVAGVNILLDGGNHIIGDWQPQRANQNPLDRVLAVPEGANPGFPHALDALAPCLIVLLIPVGGIAGDFFKNPCPQAVVRFLLRAILINGSEVSGGHALHRVHWDGNISILYVVAGDPLGFGLKYERPVLVCPQREIVAAVIVEKAPALFRLRPRELEKVLRPGRAPAGDRELRRPQVQIFALCGHDKYQLENPVEVTVKPCDFVDRGGNRVKKYTALPGVDSRRGSRKHIFHQLFICVGLKQSNHLLYPDRSIDGIRVKSYISMVVLECDVKVRDPRNP